MSKVRLLCVVASLLIALTTKGQTFVCEDVYYQATTDSTAKVVKVSGGRQYVTIPDTVYATDKVLTVTEIGSEAFYCVFNMLEVRLPHTINQIGRHAFVSCLSLRRLVIDSEQVPQTNGNIFYLFDPLQVSIEVPEQSLSAYRKADPWINMSVERAQQQTLQTLPMGKPHKRL